jgi:putative membrane protein
MQIRLEKQQIYNRWINILAIAIPLVVAVLLGVRQKVYLGEWTKALPHVNGMINSATAVLLIVGRYYISRRDINMHRKTMTAAFILGSVFLVSYVLYHMSNESTRFGAEDPLVRGVYYFLLISHIVLSVVVVWFVLRAVYFAFSNQIPAHKRVVKYAFPIWLYVSITGVIVYLMISPYY